MQRSLRRLTVGLMAGTLAAVGLAAPSAAFAAEPTDLIISEYIEGSSNNKAIEIFNPTDAAVDLAAGEYAIRMYFNGNPVSTLGINLTGTVAPGDVHVLAQASANATILAQADQTNGAGWYNGDDAIVLTRDGATATVVDSLGQVGLDPGSQWGSDLVSTADNTLRRLASVCIGDTDPADAFDPAVEWEGFATDTFDGLGAHACGDAEPVTPVINEFSANITGPDVAGSEYVEVLGAPGADLSAYTVLEIEGDSGAAVGVVDEVIVLGTADADGRILASLPSNGLENGTISLLLVTGFAGALGDDLDADNDGVFDAPTFEIIDAVAVNDGSAGDVTYGGTVLTAQYDGQAFAPGGASRIPDGTDTDTTADWIRNDFDGAGLPGFTGTPAEGEALNTPGAANAIVIIPPPPVADCEAPVVSIGSVQGTTDTSPLVGQTVEIEGVVIGDFQSGGFDGYYIQDAGDNDAATSDGVFVFAPGGDEVALGDEVHVVGEVSEFFGMTEVTAAGVAVCASGVPLPEPVAVTLPAGPEVYEPLEGMRVTLPQELTILEYFNYGRFGEIALGTDRQYQPTATYEPGSQDAIDLADANAANRITLDDGRSAQNPDPAIHPNGQEFTLENTFRGGDLVTNVTGVLDYRFDVWRVQATQGADYEAVNLRPEVPEVGGNLTVASFNVLNYFTSIGTGDEFRGANTQEEFDRQEAKIVAAISAIDADIVGLIEIENNADVALNALVDALNSEMGAGTYAAIQTGMLGTDAITTALIFKPSAVEPLGDFAVLDTAADDRFLDDYNRPALAQTFVDIESGGDITVVVNHLKSKGSDCNDVGDPIDPDGQGNCNGVRTDAAEAMVDWLATGPTGVDPGRELIIGDLNAYDKEDPIQVLTAAGYTDLLLSEQGEDAYSYVFDGQLGYLDYALAGTDLVAQVTGAAAWAINADEPSLIDYDMTFKQPAQDELFAPDAYRSSDHDPVIVGFDFIAPELSVEADPSLVFPPNNKWLAVDFDIEASDDSGAVSVKIIGTTATGHKAEIRETSDTEVEVLARQGAVYTVTFEATDPSGNTTTQEVTITVGP